MAYQNVGTPRFYVNTIEWLSTIDIDYDIHRVYRTLPTTVNSGETYVTILPTIKGFMTDQSFIAFLGHMGGNLNFTENYTDSVSINATISDEGSKLLNPAYWGFSIASWDGVITNNTRLMAATTDNNIYSIVIGSYYNMPNAPNLTLTMSREYELAKGFTTYKGSSISNIFSHSPSKWGSLGAWELGNVDSSNSSLSRSGRRSWDLKFSFMDDGDLFGANQMILTKDDYYGEHYYHPIYTGQGNTVGADIVDGYEVGDLSPEYYSWGFNYNLLTDNNFFSQVWSKTLGGTIPFIFQPDKDNSNPDQFAICRFKNNSLKAAQSSFNTYDISLSIEEVW